MQLFSLLLLHLLWDTFVLFMILKVALREKAPRWQELGGVCLALAFWKMLLFVLLKVAAIVPLLLTIGFFLRWIYSLSTRKTLYVLAAFLFVGIVFGSILRMATGVLELFFV